MVKKASVGDIVGRWAFLVGVILAIIFAFVTPSVGIVWALVIIGIIVGLLNIAVHEAQSFMLAGAVFVIVAALANQVVLISFLNSLLKNFIYLFAPATIIVALKSLWQLGSVR